ncbi:unnamed protein product [Urochloa decumbens]|uniref:NAD(P)-binding domain-containing protein n=1 Tax=Urochloa decumbens TaxID=240449 RepID=A0ABC9FKV1_9POAL
MEAWSRLKLGVSMDTVASLSPLRHGHPPSSPAACTTSRRPSPRLLKVKQRSNISSCSNSPPGAGRSRSWSRASASASSSDVTPPPRPPQKEKERDLVFVAGATGRVGSRAVRELIKLGFRVRAAVRNAERASSLVQSVQQLKLDGDAAISPVQKLEIVECDLEKQPRDGIAKAIGKASLVVCSIGASEKEILDVTGPYRIDYMATSNLVQAATTAKVEHFILVTSLGTNKIGFPAFLLNLFWGVLCWKRRAEEALIASGIPYTIRGLEASKLAFPFPAFFFLSSSTLALDSNANGIPGSSNASDQLQGEDDKTQQRPLSPYTRYEELKPPSSPTPSAPKT